MKTNQVYQYNINLSDVESLVRIDLGQTDEENNIQISWTKTIEEKNKRISIQKTGKNDTLLTTGQMVLGEFEEYHTLNVNEACKYMDEQIPVIITSLRSL